MNKPRHFCGSWHLAIIVVTLGLNSSLGQQLEGTVTANGAQPLVDVLVKAEAKGGIQTVITKTDSTGHFALSNLKTDRVLLSIEQDGKLLFRAIVSSNSKSRLEISLPSPIRGPGFWTPVDIASDAGSPVFVLDRDNGVSKVTIDSSGSHLEPFVVLPRAYVVSAIAVTQQFVFVTANNSSRCTIFRYSLDTKSDARKALADGPCVGIAVDGDALYVVFTGGKEIRYWKSWDSRYQTWPIVELTTPGPLFLDKIGHQFLVADTSSGKLYSVSMTGSRPKMLVDNIGAASGITADATHIAIASGKKILFLSRTNYRGEDPPTNLQSLTGGRIVGLAMDAAGKLWFADYDKRLVQGPLSIN